MRRRLVPIALLVCSACGTPQGSPAAAPAPALPAEAESPALATWHFLREKYDRDGDGRITSDEYTRSRDGFNTPDGVRMGYWMDSDPDSVGDDLATMLADNVDPKGDGKCQA